MKKISTVLASLPLITTACGGGGGGSGDSTVNYINTSKTIDLSQQKGIWSDSGTQTYTSPSGKQTTFQAPTGIVTSQEKMIILTGSSELYVIEPDTDTAHYFSSFSYSTSITPTASLSNSNFVFAYYNPKRDANGSVSLPIDGHYDSIIDFNIFAGTWNDNYATGSSWQFILATDGSFTASRSGSCEATGGLSHIDPAKSELAVSITFNNNCFPLQGTHTGLAWPAEEDPTGILNVAVYSGLDTSSKGIGWKLNKQ